MDKIYYVYILTNEYNTVLYTGVTSDLMARVYQHRQKLLPGFTSRYNVFKLVYYEAGIAREKQIKAGPRQKKIALITGMNPEWQDLYEQLSAPTKTVIASEAKQSPDEVLDGKGLLRRCAPRNDRFA